MKKMAASSFTFLMLAFIISCNNKKVLIASAFNYQYCSPTFNPGDLNKEGAPIFSGLGNLSYPVTAANKKAQQYFNQALTLAFAFNHGEAARSFREAAKIDSTCAMAWWGYAWVLGPNINAAMDLNLLSEANNAVNKAKAVYGKLSAKEKMFVDAITKRYPSTAPADIKEMMKYSEAFAEEMRKLHKAYPDDVTITVIFAEALLDLHPWNYWNKDGEALPWVNEIQVLLEEALKIDARHPGANHYYIHTMEASKTPEKAMASADLLQNLLPAAGHLTHMPSHIYIRTGRYHDGTIANEKASKADSNYITQCKIQGMYPLAYFPHNYHFMAATAFFEGNSKKSTEAAWLVAKFTDEKMMTEPGYGTLQHYLVIPHYTMVHFGKWDDILKLPQPTKNLNYPNAVWHYARGMAFAAKNKIPEATEELNLLNQLSKDESLKTITIWELNTVADLVSIAVNVLEAEINAANNNLPKAIELLQAAATIEDKLNYNEPPDWFFPTRHTLGHYLNKAGRFAEAETVYRRDLFLYPENGWSLAGLYNSLTGQNKNTEAAEVKNKFDTAWQWADVKINSSRIY